MNSVLAQQIAESWLRKASGSAANDRPAIVARLEHMVEALYRFAPDPVETLVAPLDNPGDQLLDGEWLDHELFVLGTDALYRLAGMEAKAIDAGQPPFAMAVRRLDFAELRPVQVTDVRSMDHGATRRTTHWTFGPSYDNRIRIVDEGIVGVDELSKEAVMARELAKLLGWP